MESPQGGKSEKEKQEDKILNYFYGNGTTY